MRAAAASRRESITLLVGAAAWPLAARARIRRQYMTPRVFCAGRRATPNGHLANRSQPQNAPSLIGFYDKKIGGAMPVARRASCY
jgi:hypothetical protein